MKILFKVDVQTHRCDLRVLVKLAVEKKKEKKKLMDALFIRYQSLSFYSLMKTKESNPLILNYKFYKITDLCPLPYNP